MENQNQISVDAEQDVVLNLKVKHVQIILSGLGEMRLRDSAETNGIIQSQLSEQLMPKDNGKAVDPSKAKVK